MDQPIVETYNGKVQGFVSKHFNGDKFYSFLGIPYAKPPVGNLRFKAPVPIESWEGIRDATKDGSKCIQKDILQSPEVEGCEDCLHLNVFTKKLFSQKSELKPTLVYIHGGAFKGGSNTTDRYGAEYLITADIVLVVPNYRVGILGFLSLEDPDLDVPGNAGLKDQRLALQWVKTNITKFNGDPNNVTIFGHSAGAMSIHYHILSPTSKCLFHRAILLSGSVFWTWSKRTEFSLKDFLNILNIKTENEKEGLQILRNLTAEELFEAQEKYLIKYAGSTLIFGPVVENPNNTSVITKDPTDLMLNGEFSKVPILATYTSDEGLLFEAIERALRASGTNIPNELPKLEEIIPIKFQEKMNNSNFNTICTEMETVYGTYDIVMKKSLLRSDLYFITPLIAAVQTHAVFSPEPVYLLKWIIDDELNATKSNSLISDIPGTCHGDELGYIFKNKFLPTPTKGSNADKAITRIIGLIKNFSYFGNPTPYEDEFGLIWQTLQEDSKFYIEFGTSLTPKYDPEPDRMKFWQKIVEFDKRNLKMSNLKIYSK